MILRLCLLLVPLLLGACSSTEEKQTPPLMSQRMSDRIANSRKRMGDPNDRSVFDKSMQSSVTKGKDTGGWLGKKNFKSNAYAGTQSYTNTSGYKTGSFSGSNDDSSMAKQTFAQSDKADSAAASTFKTDNSRFAEQSAPQGSQTFTGADDVFRTASNRDALRSQKKNDRPQFIESEEHQRKPAYTEDQVRRLLGRQ